MQQEEPEVANALVPRRQQACELQEEPARAEKQALGVGHLGRQLELCLQARRRREEAARLGRRAERLVELFDHARAATLRQPFARQLEQRSDGGDADAAEKLDVEARHLDRQSREVGFTCAASKPKRRARGGRAAEVKGVAELLQPGRELLA